MAENIDLIQDIMPKLSRVQAQRRFMHTIQPKSRQFLKKNLVAQGTTTKRTEITVEKQFLLINTYENSLALLCKKNTGKFCLTKKYFGKVIHNFFIAEMRRVCKSTTMVRQE